MLNRRTSAGCSFLRDKAGRPRAAATGRRACPRVWQRITRRFWGPRRPSRSKGMAHRMKPLVTAHAVQAPPWATGKERVDGLWPPHSRSTRPSPRSWLHFVRGDHDLFCPWSRPEGRGPRRPLVTIHFSNACNHGLGVRTYRDDCPSWSQFMMKSPWMTGDALLRPHVNRVCIWPRSRFHEFAVKVAPAVQPARTE